MKKLMLLPALGAAAALTYGAAATLNVTGNAAPIQVGEVNDLACAEEAKVQGWGYDDGTEAVYWAWIDVKDVNNNCDGDTLYVTPFDKNGNFLFLKTNAAQGGTGKVTLGTDSTGSNGDWDRYQVFFGTNYGPAGGGVDASDLARVRLGIDQGGTLGTIGS